MKINENAEQMSSDDFFYDLFEGGYIDPEKLLADKSDVDRVKEAITTIEDFKSACEEAEVLVEA